MPALSILKAVKSQTGLSTKRIDHLWDKAKRLVVKQYGLRKGQERFYAAVMGIFKKMTKYKPKSQLTEEGYALEQSLKESKLLRILEAYIYTR